MDCWLFSYLNHVEIFVDLELLIEICWKILKGDSEAVA